MNFLQELMLKVMKMDEIKFTSSSVWEKRENPDEYWNGKEWNGSLTEWVIEEEGWFIQQLNKLDCVYRNISRIELANIC